MNKRQAAEFFSLGTRRGWTRQVATLAPEHMSRHLPEKLRQHPGASGFMADVRDSAELVAQRASFQGTETPDALRDRFKAVEGAAHRMQAALSPLARASEAFDCLDAHAKYLLWRTREASKRTEGRPGVPAMHTDAADLAGMLQRVHDDLKALRVLCDYAAAQPRGGRSELKYFERQLITAVVKHHQRHFFSLPPKRSWFADDFMLYIGVCIEMKIGHNIVGEVVATQG